MFGCHWLEFVLFECPARFKFTNAHYTADFLFIVFEWMVKCGICMMSGSSILNFVIYASLIIPGLFTNDLLSEFFYPNMMI